jgi:hypothetical protein
MTVCYLKSTWKEKYFDMLKKNNRPAATQGGGLFIK